MLPYNAKVHLDTNILIIIGKAIKEKRIANGYTQTRLAEIAHVHRNFISCVEKGTRSATITTLNQLLEGLGTNIFAFMSELAAQVKSK